MTEILPETLWFMDGHVTIQLAKAANAGGISLTEHLLPSGFGPPYHVHRVEDETIYVLEGELRIDVGGVLRETRAGQAAHLPRGVPHGFRVVSPQGARVLVISNGGFEAMIRAASRPAAFGGLPERVAPTPKMQVELAAVCAAHGIDVIGPSIE